MGTYIAWPRTGSVWNSVGRLAALLAVTGSSRLKYQAVMYCRGRDARGNERFPTILRFTRMNRMNRIMSS